MSWSLRDESREAQSRLCYSRESGNPVFPIGSGYPPEFTPYVIRGGFDKQTEFKNRLQLEVFKKVDLVKDDRKIDAAENNDDSLDHGTFAVHAQEGCRERDNAELPDPEVGAVKIHRGTNNGVYFAASHIENHHREQGVEDVQPGNQDEKKEDNRTMALDIRARPAVFPSPDMPSLAQEGEPAH